MNKLTHLSLFSGIGGLDLAAEWAGFKTVGQCEWAEYPTKVLKKHWPNVPRWRDIRELSADEFVRRTGLHIGQLKIISGGFPCQPFSVAGKQRGKEDDRYLWPEMLRVIRELQPTWIIGENVPGIINLALDTVLSDLERENYACRTFVFPAHAVGARHRRDRVCIVGYAEHDGLSAAKIGRVNFEDARERLPKAKKVVYTGTPTKIEKKEYGINEKANIIKQIGLSETKPIVLIFGGSQGAQKINEAILNIIKEKLNSNYQIMWATGPKQYDVIKEELEKNRININHIENTKIVPYIYNMEEVMNVSDIIVARSGAMTIAEISNLGKPSILIPLPNVSGDHQLYNAKVLESVGAAKIILNDKLEASNLNDAIQEIVLDKAKIKSMQEKALTKAAYDVENKIYQEIKMLKGE